MAYKVPFTKGVTLAKLKPFFDRRATYTKGVKRVGTKDAKIFPKSK